MREIKFRAWLPQQQITQIVTPENLLEMESDYFGGKPVWLQYTGLRDRNGVEIYEGDIVQNRRTSSAGQAAYKVIWNEYGGEWGFEPFPLAGNKPFSNRVLLEDWEMINDAEVVIIGNIHENPELLEDQQ